MSPFANSVVRVEKLGQDWHAVQYPPVGDERIGKPYRTRREARVAATELRKALRGDGYNYERSWGRSKANAGSHVSGP